MIVDDSVSVRRVTQRLIEHTGWTAVTARDGVDALETLSRMDRAPDVFLLDVEMPRMDGYQLLSSLRQQERFAETPIIMITSRSGEKHRQMAMLQGATAYLTKPFHDEALIELIQSRHLASQAGAS
jgi:chemosensory pili system protein ChpA (sensor histidine kinase/response regulator)